MIEFISQLPTEYQEVEYIQSSGTQYIDTGVVATSGFEIDIKINIDTVTGSWAPILAAHELSAPYKRNFIAYTSSKKMEIDAGDKITQTSVTLTGDDVIKASNVENNFYLNVNGTNYTPTVTTAASNLAYSGRTMHLLHSNGYDFGYTSGKVYYCKITVDGTLVRNFVPCYRKSDNIVGLYDLVNGVFYTNAGTGNFAKGKNSNSHVDAVITPGGVIMMQYALRRRMRAAEKKTWTVTLTGTHMSGAFDSEYPEYWADNAVVYQGKKYLSGSFEVFDGDSIQVYCSADSEYYPDERIGYVYLNGTIVTQKSNGKKAYTHIVKSNCEIRGTVLQSSWDKADNYIITT